MKLGIIFQSIGFTVAGVCAGFPNAAQLQQDQMQSQCSIESKSQYYREFLASYEGVGRDHAKALESARRFLACPKDHSDQEESLAEVNLAVGRMLNLKNLSTEAIPYLIKAVSYTSNVKTSPQTYADLAQAYEEGPYAKLAAVYGSRFSGKDETAESLLALENIYQVVDRMIDAYARAVALDGVELSTIAQGYGLRTRRSPTGPMDWIEALSEFYKFRHKGSDAGLKDLIETILSKPIPLEPHQITSLPPRKK